MARQARTAYSAAMTNQQVSLSDWLLIILLSVIWAWSYVFNRFALQDLPVMTVVLGRVGIAALVLAPLALATGRRLPGTLRLWMIIMGMSLLNNIIPFSLIVGGQVTVDSGLAAIVIGTTPLIGAVIAHWASGGDERLTPSRLVGVLTGFAGLVVLIGPSALAGLGDQVQGQLLLLGAALSYALAAVYGRRTLRGVAPVTAASGQLICSTIVVLPVAAVVDRPWDLSPGVDAWLSILGLSIVCTAFAYLLYFRILARAGATNLLLVTFLVPAGAVFVGWLVAGEVITWPMLGGMALILTGLAIMDGRVFGRLIPRRRAARH